MNAKISFRILSKFFKAIFHLLALGVVVLYGVSYEFNRCESEDHSKIYRFGLYSNCHEQKCLSLNTVKGLLFLYSDFSKGIVFLNFISLIIISSSITLHIASLYVNAFKKLAIIFEGLISKFMPLSRPYDAIYIFDNSLLLGEANLFCNANVNLEYLYSLSRGGISVLLRLCVFFYLGGDVDIFHIDTL
ncbi:hypothetical protein RF11_02236 [Thelohanellus kitauei]|uniref:Uncharacterized protein n=1 Tax=Thelohanellus kitauei TaxID=669202 RepID=A0A0C2J2X1_THEKT|nr:hypothetical protein RF11_02236 [Thelohanellus kitauei]